MNHQETEKARELKDKTREHVAGKLQVAHDSKKGNSTKLVQIGIAAAAAVVVVGVLMKTFSKKK